MRAREKQASKDATLNELVLEVRRLRLNEDRLRSEIEHLLEAQQALEDSRDQYAELYDLSPVAWVTLDRNGAIENLNLVALTLLGFGRGHLVGAPLGAFVRPEHRRRLLDHLLTCRSSPDPVTCELQLAARGGTPIPVRMSTRRRRGTEESYASALLD
ncbi:MAG TPA: PAS domain-containing protein, partial [Polyangiaceae bacterium]|nr:PAS domain-containing protein [Polyangiaceae bacterium]